MTPFNQNFRFKFSTTFSSEWNSIFKNFQKGDNLARYTQIVEIFSRKLFFHSTDLPEFLEFSVEWFAFGNSTVSGISGNFSGKFLCHLPLFPHFRTVWLNRKRPYFPCSTPRVFDINPSQTIITKKRKQECKCLKLKSLNASPEVNIFHETQLHKC